MDVTWAKSSFSFSNGNCVEVAGYPAASVGRDSRDPAGPVLRFTRNGGYVPRRGAARNVRGVLGSRAGVRARYRASLTAGPAPPAGQPSWPTLRIVSSTG